MQNEFRICGDFVHLFAFLILIRTIFSKRSCAGISGKSQLLIATVFTCRYLDLFTVYISFYNTVFKIIYLGLAYFTVYLIFVKFRKTYDNKNDSFWNIFIIVTAVVFSLYVNYLTLNNSEDGLMYYEQYIRNPFEVAWTFSIYLEALAIIPQFYMIKNTGNGQNVLYYILALTTYRALYICNWIYRYFKENYLDPISLFSGAAQTLILFVLLIYIQKCKEKNVKWQEISEVFTIEAAQFGNSEKAQQAQLYINKPQVEDANRLLP